MVPWPWHPIDLGTLGGANAAAQRLNNRGQILGWSTRAGDEVARYLVRWDHGRIEEIGSPTQNILAEDVYLNDRGQIAGAFAPTPDGVHPFLWECGRFIDLGTLGGPTAVPTGLNSWGEVIGRSFTDSMDQHGFIWRHGHLQDIGTLGGGFSSADAINDLGFVAGDSSTAALVDHGFLWWNRSITDITPRVTGSAVRAVAINLRNEVALNIALQSFVWSDGRLRQLPDLGGPVEVYDMNDEGVIVGRASDGVVSNAAIWVPEHCATSHH